MKVLILQGPNFNLIGIRSAKAGDRITMDKMNTALKKECREKEVELKILQTGKAYKALNFLHRNKNWADGILFVPMAWALYEHSLKEALDIIEIPTVEITLEKPYSAVSGSSIFSDVCISNIKEKPDTVFQSALNALLDHLSA